MAGSLVLPKHASMLHTVKRGRGCPKRRPPLHAKLQTRRSQRLQTLAPPSSLVTVNNSRAPKSNPVRSPVNPHRSPRRGQSLERGNSCLTNYLGSMCDPRHPQDCRACTLLQRWSASWFAWQQSRLCRHPRRAVHTSSARSTCCPQTHPAGLLFPLPWHRPTR